MPVIGSSRRTSDMCCLIDSSNRSSFLILLRRPYGIVTHNKRASPRKNGAVEKTGTGGGGALQGLRLIRKSSVKQAIVNGAMEDYKAMKAREAAEKAKAEARAIVQRAQKEREDEEEAERARIEAERKAAQDRQDLIAGGNSHYTATLKRDVLALQDAVAKGSLHTDASVFKTFHTAPVHVAASIGETEVLRWLVEENQSNIDVLNKKGWYPAHYAAESGQNECVQWILERSPKQGRAKDEKHRQPMHLAASGGHLEACKFLKASGGSVLSNMAQENATLSKKGSIYLVLSTPGGPRSEETVWVEPSDTVLMAKQRLSRQQKKITVEAQKWSFVGKELKNFKNVSSYKLSDGSHLSCEVKNAKAVEAQRILDQEAAQKEFDEQSHIVSHERAAMIRREMQFERRKALEEQGEFETEKEQEEREKADAEEQEQFLAIRQRMVESEEKKKKFAPRLLGCEDVCGRLPIHYAAEHGHLELVRWLIETGKEEFGDERHYLDNDGTECLVTEATSEAVAVNGFTPMHLAAKGGQVLVMEYLFDECDSSTTPAANANGLMPLHLAAMAGACDAITWLVERGAPVQGPSADGSSPLHYAAEQGQLQAAICLIENGGALYPAPVDNSGLTPAHRAAEAGQTKIMKWIHAKEKEEGVPKGKMSCTNAKSKEQKQVCMHLAARAGQVRVMQWLHEDLAQPLKISDANGLTPLDLAGIFGWQESVEELYGESQAKQENKKYREEKGFGGSHYDHLSSDDEADDKTGGAAEGGDDAENKSAAGGGGGGGGGGSKQVWFYIGGGDFAKKNSDEYREWHLREMAEAEKKAEEELLASMGVSGVTLGGEDDEEGTPFDDDMLFDY
jgi:ankyrin repeat protein